tara:strand:- start:2412 stop:2774 length:363 start_codon:yes stop_codon:yes gene_type:complete
MVKDIHTDVIGQTEDALQQKCVFWFHNEYPNLRGLLFSVPNGGFRTNREGGKLKQTGIVSGVSDLILMVSGKTYCLELKIEKKKQSPTQIEWQAKVEKQGFDYSVIRSLLEFKSKIREII